METNQEIYNRIEREIRIMILEAREGMNLSNSTGCIMNFVTKGITRTLIARDMVDTKKFDSIVIEYKNDTDKIEKDFNKIVHGTNWIN